MKTILKIFFIAIVFSSCSNKEECYDCDQTLNEWISKNYELIQTFDRSDIIKYDAEIQRSIFIALTPDRKKAMWQDKITHLKSVTTNNNELEFLSQVEIIIENTSFEKAWTDQEMDKFKNMLDEATSEFNWTFDFIVYAFGSLDNLKYIDGVWEIDYTVRFDPGTMPIGTTPDCNCKWGWCPGGECSSKSCEETTLGCGFLLLGSCTGIGAF